MKAEIPKIIHYCWFGGAPLPDSAVEAIQTWETYMPDCVIKRWDEANFDYQHCDFSNVAYQEGKWAYVSDYARFKILEQYGGIYMDVGSFLVQSIQPLIARGAFSARENETSFVSPGLIIAAPPSHRLVSETVQLYEGTKFADDADFYKTHTVNNMFASVLKNYGYENTDILWSTKDFTVYPSTYFSPRLGFGGYKFTPSTYSYHKSSGSWVSDYEKLRLKLMNRLTPYTGDFIARKTARILCMLRYGKRR